MKKPNSKGAQHDATIKLRVPAKDKQIALAQSSQKGVTLSAYIRDLIRHDKVAEREVQ